MSLISFGLSYEKIRSILTDLQSLLQIKTFLKIIISCVFTGEGVLMKLTTICTISFFLVFMMVNDDDDDDDTGGVHHMVSQKLSTKINLIERMLSRSCKVSQFLFHHKLISSPRQVGLTDQSGMVTLMEIGDGIIAFLYLYFGCCIFDLLSLCSVRL